MQAPSCLSVGKPLCRHSTVISRIVGLTLCLCAASLIFLANGCGLRTIPTGNTLTFRNDNLRTGQNLYETVLTPANVNSSRFGKVFSYAVDGAIYGQPLYVKNLQVPNHGARNVIFVATQHDSVYAFDADQKATGALWQVSFINPASGVTSVPCIDESQACDFIGVEIGITGTPVIDLDSNTLYVCAFTKENGSYAHRLHALDLATGSEKFGGPVLIQGSVPGMGVGTDGVNIAFNPYSHLQRSALLLKNGVVYVAFGPFADAQPYHGWLFAYNALTLKQRTVLNMTPNGAGAGIWQSANGPASDDDGNIYVVTGNGSFDADVGGQNFGDSFVRLKPEAGSISVADFFTPFNQAHLNAYDADLGAGGPLLFPDQEGSHPHLMLAGGKEGTLYLVDRDKMGHFNAADDSQIVQSLVAIVPRIFSSPAFWENKVYIVGAKDSLKVFSLKDGLLSTAPAAQSANTFNFPGATPVISANGSQDGMVWAIENGLFRLGKSAILHAYDANDVTHELYNSQQAGTRDALPMGVGFAVPTVANGKVYMGTLSELVVFGPLP